jgi:histidinol-phosphate aminotransferase
MFEKFFRQEVLDMSAYHVADAKNLIKLDAMENPYPWPEQIQQIWLEDLKSCSINRYPDPQAETLKSAIRNTYQIADDLDLLLGNGSDEIIQILLMAMPTCASVLCPEPTFVMYRQISQSLGLAFNGVSLQPDSFELDLQAMLAAIEKNRPALIFLAYPNNPTGNLFDKESIKAILSATSGLVVIDEAYEPFANSSFIDAIGEYENLLVMRTVSKLGLAGLRLGFLIGRPPLLSQLDKIRLPYNINILTQVTASFAMNNNRFLFEQAQAISEQRQLLFNALKAIENILVYSSSANFILFKSIKIPADEVFLALKRQGVLIKNLSHQNALLHNCLRVTVGTSEENQVFLNALKNVI